jgi:uncharacterized protein DUF6879
MELSRDAALKKWDEWWAEMKGEWFKVETLQDYSGEDGGDKSLREWLSGNRKKSLKLMLQSSRDWIRQAQSTSANKIRIHIVEEPFSPYLSWEIEHYKRINVPLAGETVYLVPKKELDTAVPDFMIFDNKKAVVNHYDRLGKLVGMSFYEGNIDEFLNMKRKLLDLGEPIG